MCGDDGFAWQQKDNPACQAASQTVSESESNSNSMTESESDSVPTESNSNTESASDTDSGMSNTQGGGQYCADMDMDGHGDPMNCMDEMFPGSVPNNDDCNDGDPNTFPGSAELDSETACMTDADDDGYGEKDPLPGVEPGTDCDDSNPDTFPGSAELDDPMACMQDEDGDGYGDEMPSDPDVPPGTDCDDGNIFTFPGSAPLDDPEACMTDEDDDDYGDDNPGPGVDPGTDCADYNELEHENCTGCEPNGAECNGDDLEQCNADGTDFMVTPCEFGCDDNGEKCWDPLTVDAGSSLCIDANDMIQLDAVAMGGDGNYTWNWTPAMGLSDPMIPNPTSMPPGPVDYTIEVMDGEGNIASDTVSVFLTNQVLPFDPNVCTIYDFPYDANLPNDPDPDWQFDDQTQTLCQQGNAKASALFCGWTLDNATINGRFRVNTATDDDWVGFMWGIQDTDHFYVFTWKQAGQQSTTCGAVPFMVPGGMQVKRVGVVDPNVPLDCPDMIAPNDTANSVLLQSVDQFTTMGWADNTEYVFDLTHLANGDQTIVIRNAMTMAVVAMTTFNDTTYPSGQFGMYTKSQEAACFAGFEVDCM